MKVLITEGTTDILYHFASLRSVITMLKDDSIALTLGQHPGIKDGREEEIMDGYTHFLSMTSTKSFDLGYQGNTTKKNVCLTLDGRMIKNNYKVKRVAYFDNDDRRNDAVEMNVNGYDEMEERLLTNKTSIPFTKLVKKISISSERVDHSDEEEVEFVNIIKKLAERRGVMVEVIGKIEIPTNPNTAIKPDHQSYNTGVVATILRMTLAFLPEYYSEVKEAAFKYMSDSERTEFTNQINSGDINIVSTSDDIKKILNGDFTEKDFKAFKSKTTHNLMRISEYNKRSDIETNTIKVFLKAVRGSGKKVSYFFADELTNLSKYAKEDEPEDPIDNGVDFF